VPHAIISQFPSIEPFLVARTGAPRFIVVCGFLVIADVGQSGVAMRPQQTTLDPPQVEARRYRRFKLALPVHMKFVSGATGQEIETISENISVGGVLVRSTVLIPQHTAVTLVVDVHGEKALRPVHVVGEGQVARVEKVEAGAAFLIAVECNAPLGER